MSTTTTVWTPCTVCWMQLKLATPATRRSGRYPGHFWCDEHAVSSDPPFGEVSTAVAVGQVRDRVWSGLDEPQGLSDE